MKKVILTFILLLAASPLFAKEEIIFTGIPDIKISEGGTSRIPEKINKDRAIGFKCTITKIDDRYYWTTRENIELVPIPSGAFITYWAANGSGYVRIVKPEMKSRVKEMGAMAGDPEEIFDYVEHLLIGLKSITYYGTSK
ncbi:MAG: hypothetical protein AB1306_04000 [Nitrospirota bacterium]